MCEITTTEIFLTMLILFHSCKLINSSISTAGRRILNNSTDNKIKMIHGDDASLYEYTFMAILVKYGYHTRRQSTTLEGWRESVVQGKSRLICGGAIIHKDWILTAAKCFKKNSNLRQFNVYAGIINLKDETGQQIRQIEKVSIHPDYSQSSDEFNIAMIKVTASFIFTTYVSAGYLPVNPLTITGTERCHILGFVREYDTDTYEKIQQKYEDRLIKVQLHATDYRECLDRLKLLHAQKPYTLTKKNYCLIQIEDYPRNNSQGACEGDVGGPCICGFKIQGVIAHYTDETCFKVGYPTTIVDVGHHLNWVRSNILQLNIVPKSLGIQRTANKRFLLQIFCFAFLLLIRI